MREADRTCPTCGAAVFSGMLRVIRCNACGYQGYRWYFPQLQTAPSFVEFNPEEQIVLTRQKNERHKKRTGKNPTTGQREIITMVNPARDEKAMQRYRKELGPDKERDTDG